MSNDWENPVGYITKDRQTIALLLNETASVGRLFDVLVSQAFTRTIMVRLPNNTYQEWDPGARPWSLRQLAKTAMLSINTVVKGLRRLVKLGLIRKVSSKLGTVIQALNFFQYRRKNHNIGETPPFSKGVMPQRGDTRLAKSDHYRIALNKILDKQASIVDVAASVPVVTVEEKQPTMDKVRYLVSAILSGRALSVEI